MDARLLFSLSGIALPSKAVLSPSDQRIFFFSLTDMLYPEKAKILFE